jgi:environmental stress-induced protein Ves
MIEIIPPEQFNTIPWKNGKGQTTELAISENGTIDNFDWRLSIASVVEDGPFSDFSGYERNLILLEGQGIELTHDHKDDDKQIDLLDKPLSISSFNGSAKTLGRLIDGAISDFNLMTKDGKYNVEVIASIGQQVYQITNADLCFVYSHQSYITLKTESEDMILPTGFLAMIEDFSELVVNGANLIVITLEKI